MKVTRLVIPFLVALVPAVAFAQPTPAPTSTRTPEPAPAPTSTPTPTEPTTAGAPAEPAAVAPIATPAAPADQPAAPVAKLTYDKGFTLSSGDDRFELKASIRSQSRLEVVKPDGKEFQDHFVVPRLRLQLEGFAYGKPNSYKVEFDMANKGSALLKDFFVDHDFGGIHLRAGQWKRPFSRHEMVSDFSGEFNERSIANEFGGGGRDLGIALHNNYEKSPEGLEWAAGVFNGTGEKPIAVKCANTAPGVPVDPTTCTAPSNVPADFKPVAVVRAGWNHGGIKGYWEGDVEGGPLRYAAAASYKLDLNGFNKDAAGNDKPGLGHAAEVDGILKVEGLSVTGALYLVKVGDADAQTGFFGQAGYMVVPKTFEVAGRFSQIPDPKMSTEHVHEALAAFNWYFGEGHNFKWMTDAGVLHTTADSKANLQVRSQLQFVF